MFKLAAVLFAIAALGGATMATLHFSGRHLPLPLAILHGAFAASGLVVLASAVLRNVGSGPANLSLVLFLLAALLGFVLLSFYLRPHPLPTPLILIHGGVAVVALVRLIILVVTEGR